MSEDVFTDMLEDDFDDEVIENINQIKMDKPSKEVLAIIRGIVSKAINENDKEEFFLGLHGYMGSIKACLKEKKDLQLVDKWLAQLVAE